MISSSNIFCSCIADIWIQPGNVLATASRCSTILAERDSFSVQSERVVQGKIFLVKA